MKFRFRRRIRLFPGVNINLGKSGASVSVGPRGAKMTVGTKGVTGTVGLPGTGVFLSKQQAWQKRTSEVGTMSKETIAIVTERPPHWEFVFLQNLLATRLEEMDMAWQRGSSEPMDVQTYCSWGVSHVNQLMSLLHALRNVLEVNSVEAVGPPGKPGDPEKIAAIVEDVSNLLGQIIVWEQVVLVFAEHPIFGNVARKMSGMSWPFIDTVNKFKEQLDEQLLHIAETKRIDIGIKMAGLPHVDEHIAVLEAFAKEALDEGIEGDFFQTDFRLKRGETLLGRFSRRTVLENLNAELFRPDDLYWSEKRLAWRSLRALETEGDLKIPSPLMEGAGVEDDVI